MFYFPENRSKFFQFIAGVCFMLRTFFLSLLIPVMIFSQSDNAEFRATWVITWEHMGTSAEAGKAKIREILDNHVAANMNAVLFQARQSGTAYYNSSFEPWGYYAGYQDPGYDPLEYSISEAHKRGLELHAWFNVFQASSMHAGAPAYEHPEWVCRDQSGIPMNEARALSPGLDAVREYTLNVAMEIVNNYDIDGLHLDYIRWNEYSNGRRQDMTPQEEESLLDGMISEDQIQELENSRTGRYLYDVDHPYSAGVPAGFGSWEEWWRWSVTEFVQQLHDSIQAVKPYVRLSAAALGKYNWSGWQGYGSVFQDAALWFNQGYIDQLTPMHYHWTNANGFLGMLVNDCPNCWSDYLTSGINAERIYTVGPGSYILDENGTWSNHESIINAVRTVTWTSGFQFFSYGTWAYHDYWTTAQNSFFSMKTKMPVNVTGTEPAPTAPILVLTKLDSLHYDIEVTPADTGVAWTIMYRSEDDQPDIATDQIIHVAFADSALSFVDEFDGTQDYNGSYYYFATQANRYWAESVPSNAVASDSIPSFAPVIISSYPAHQDSVPVATDLEFVFSKTMDPSSATTAITINPDPGHSLVWSDNNKRLAVNFYYNLDYAATYTVSISSALTDINQVGLDSDMDGIPDDNYSLVFYTYSQDVFGPQITGGTITDISPAQSLDIGQLITVVFDEEVQSSSLNSNTVQLVMNNADVPFGYHHSVVNEHSVYTLRPADGNLAANAVYELLFSDGINDLHGNTMTPVSFTFSSEPMSYSSIAMIEEFDNVNNWWDPTGSGSTVGVLSGTSFGTSNLIYVPGTYPTRSGKLSYVWDTSASEWLIREYLSGGPPRDVQFDTSYTLECYIYGDGSHNYFRFALDDHLPATAADYHEVSPWYEIDWEGWKLVSWDLGSEPAGSWLGNGILEGTLRTDSFQMTYNPDYQISSGTIYFDDYRIVQKYYNLKTDPESPPLPAQLKLYPNYPNPFNPVTHIEFDIPVAGMTTLTIYNLQGQAVNELIQGHLNLGHHQVTWNGTNHNGTPVSSGMYFCQLQTEYGQQLITMVFMK